jgi:hypothetical protein
MVIINRYFTYNFDDILLKILALISGLCMSDRCGRTAPQPILDRTTADVGLDINHYLRDLRGLYPFGFKSISYRLGL